MFFFIGICDLKLSTYDPDAPEEPANPVKNPPSTTRTARQPANPKGATSAASPSAAPTALQKRGKGSLRRGKLGRNQYTRDRDSVAGSRSDVGGSREGEGSNNGGRDQLLSNGSKPSRPKVMSISRTSINEMRKRAAGILEFISQTQVEMAGEKTPPKVNGQNEGQEAKSTPRISAPSEPRKLSQEVPHDDAQGESSQVPKSPPSEKDRDGARVNETDFKEMNSREMMDVLSREIVLWQMDHGKYGEK